MRLATIALALGVSAAGAAIAAKPSPLGPPPPSGAGLPAGQCFRSQEIRNHTIGDPSTLLINVRGKESYRVTMRGACLAGATASDPIITRSPPGSTIICKPIDMDVSISKGGFATPCIVDSIVRLSPDEIAALPRKLKP
ncbi:hypothetical protein [Phenylobacterium sp.]|uniref:hypothetical protein n=1 Tax=Phenylobacterium sp. TaxID=1871053 RepID=UPI002EDB5612